MRCPFKTDDLERYTGRVSGVKGDLVNSSAMPLYEYQCRALRTRIRGAGPRPADTRPACPSCKGQDLERLLSAPAGVTSPRSDNLALARAERKRWQPDSQRPGVRGVSGGAQGTRRAPDGCGRDEEAQGRLVTRPLPHENHPHPLLQGLKLPSSRGPCGRAHQGGAWGRARSSSRAAAASSPSGSATRWWRRRTPHGFPTEDDALAARAAGAGARLTRSGSASDPPR